MPPTSHVWVTSSWLLMSSLELGPLDPVNMWRRNMPHIRSRSVLSAPLRFCNSHTHTHHTDCMACMAAASAACVKKRIACSALRAVLTSLRWSQDQAAAAAVEQWRKGTTQATQGLPLRRLVSIKATLGNSSSLPSGFKRWHSSSNCSLS